MGYWNVRAPKKTYAEMKLKYPESNEQAYSLYELAYDSTGLCEEDCEETAYIHGVSVDKVVFYAKNEHELIDYIEDMNISSSYYDDKFGKIIELKHGGILFNVQEDDD